MTKTDIQSWLKQHGSPKFADTLFFPGAVRTVPFGVALKIEKRPGGRAGTTKRLRIHNAVDRWKGWDGGMVVVSFDSEVEFIADKYHKSFGTLLFLRPKDADFEFRIAHLNPETFTDEFRLALANGFAEKGTLIGPAGNEGLSTAPHTHLETVSSGEHSRICDTIIEAQKDEVTIDTEYIDSWANRSGVVSNTANNDFRSQFEVKRIEKITTKRCVRIDYHTGEKRTFYNSWAVFNCL